MKRTLFCLFSIISLFSCTSTGYKIEGVIEDPLLNGQTVFIKERINRVWIPIDSVKIENGIFSFKGVCDSARIAYLDCELPSGEKIRQAFVFENGNIMVKIDSASFIFSGTPQNDLLQTYLNEKKLFYINSEAFYKANNDSNQTKEQKAAFAAEMEKLSKEEVSIDLKYALANVNTIVGTHIFMSSFYAMSIAEKESVISQMNDDTKKIKRIQEIIADIEIEKKTTKGQLFTDIKLPSLTGDSLALSSLVGKTDYVLVDFWASWCAPCIQSLPEMKELYNINKGKRLEILGVSLDDNEEAWKSAIAKHDLTWKHISDLQGWKCKGAKLYAVNSIPATVLIDKSGKIVGRNMSIGEIESVIEKSTEKR
ncbi:MAG: TlpA disulfide reductase family protein [Paludibacter sp.]